MFEVGAACRVTAWAGVADDQRQRQAAEYVQGRNEGVAGGVTVGDIDRDMREPVGYNDGYSPAPYF